MSSGVVENGVLEKNNPPYAFQESNGSIVRSRKKYDISRTSLSYWLFYYSSYRESHDIAYDTRQENPSNKRRDSTKTHRVFAIKKPTLRDMAVIIALITIFFALMHLGSLKAGCLSHTGTALSSVDLNESVSFSGMTEGVPDDLRNSPDPEEALRDYYTLIDNSRLDEAYSLQSMRVQDRLSYTQFQEMWVPNRGVRVNDLNLLSRKGNKAVIRLALSADDPDCTGKSTTTPWTGIVKLVLERGKWRYDGGDFETADSTAALLK